MERESTAVKIKHDCGYLKSIKVKFLSYKKDIYEMNNVNIVSIIGSTKNSALVFILS